MPRIPFVTAWFLAALMLLAAGLAQAQEPTQVVFSAAYADFALDPATGDVVAVDADRNTVVLHRRADLERGVVEPAESLRVGQTPVSVFYKVFEDTRVFAVVCSQESRMYLIDADTFEELERLDIGQIGASLVTGSQNPDDPFLYFCFGSGHDSATGVMSLRDMRLHGNAFGDSMDCAISADGGMAYRRGPWSPSGFESLVMSNSFEDDKPVFTRRYYDHASRGGYLPGPFGEYTVTSRVVYDRTLARSVAQMPFTPYAFFATRPVIFGIEPDGIRNVNRRQRNPQPLNFEVCAASFNTFTEIGDRVEVNFGVPAAAELPRGVQGQGDFKQVVRRFRMIPDEARGMLVIAYQQNLALVPLEAFNLPDEPFMHARFEGDTQLAAGQRASFTLVPMDERVEIDFDDLPDGAEADGNLVTWTPRLEDVGSYRLAVTLEHGDLQRTLTHAVTVTYPAIDLPFKAGGIAADRTQSRAVVWEGVQRDVHGREVRDNMRQTHRLAVVDLDSGRVLAQRQLANPINRCLVSGDNVVLWTPNLSPRIEVLAIGDLERKKTLVAGGTVAEVYALGEHLVLQTNNGVEIYHSDGFERVRTFGTTFGNQRHPGHREGGAPLVSAHGLFYSNVLFDDQLEPKLLLLNNNLPVLEPDAGYQRLQGYPGTLQPTNNSMQQLMQQRRAGRNVQRVAQTAVPGQHAFVALDRTNTTQQVPGAVHTNRTLTELTATYNTVNGTQRQPLYRREVFNQQTQTQPTLLLDTDAAYILDQQELFVWPYPDPDEEHAGADIRWEPRQSATALADGESTTLTHEATGGKGELDYVLLTQHAGMAIDAETGTITIDNETVIESATQSIIDTLVEANIAPRELALAQRRWAQTAQDMLGREPTGLPVAVPIQVQISDEDLRLEQVWYYIIAEVPHEPFARAYAEAREALQARQDEMERPGDVADDAVEAAPGNRPATDRELVERIETLEARIDLLTRQINQLMEMLEAQQNQNQREGVGFPGGR
ncbi:MAG: hypothetical protein AAGA29_11265 [Planctomycetota bacterium]